MHRVYSTLGRYNFVSLFSLRLFHGVCFSTLSDRPTELYHKIRPASHKLGWCDVFVGPTAPLAALLYCTAVCRPQWNSQFSGGFLKWVMGYQTLCELTVRKLSGPATKGSVQSGNADVWECGIIQQLKLISWPTRLLTLYLPKSCEIYLQNRVEPFFVVALLTTH
jgi:hypothetical protein